MLVKEKMSLMLKLLNNRAIFPVFLNGFNSLFVTYTCDCSYKKLP